MPADPKLVRDLFLAVAELPEADRAAYLQTHAQGNAELQAAVERLLAAHDQPASLLNQPAMGMPTADFPGISERPGTMIGPYRLMEKIGEGGFGLVFVAEQTEPVKRKVALKVIKPGMDSKQVIARFEAERQALAMMDHPNIARVLDAGTTETGRPYFVMELVRGIPITEYCDQNHLTPAERLELFVSVCHAIQHAHQKGIIHRDIKPSNVLVTSHDGKPVAKVIDFGVAKAIHQHLTEQTIYTQFAQMIGTPLYMSPEQAEMSGLDIDTRSDIYSLGVLLYELLTGTTPLERKRLAQAAYDEIRRVIREEDPPRPSDRLSTSNSLPSLAANRKTEPTRLSRMLKGELDWIVMKALEKDRTRRYETANGFARDIQRYLCDEVVEARPASAGYRLRKLIRRNKGRVLAASLVFLALLAGVAVSTWQAIRATRAEHLALEARQAEVERAEGERQAKLDAEAQKEQAQKRLKQIEKANEILGSIFENLDPKEIAKAERPLQAILVEKLDMAVAQLEGESIGDPQVVAAMQYKFGSSLLGLGEPGKAIVLLENARATCRAKLGPDHPHTLASMNNLALAYQAAGKPDLALPLLEETLKLSKAKRGPEHPHTLTNMNNLATAYQATGKLDLAVPLMEETLKLSIAKLGPEHPVTLDSMGNLADAYRAAGKLDLAVPLHKETLKLTKARLGPEHPTTLTRINNLAVAYQDAGKLELALPLYEETLKLMNAKLGPEHPATLTSMNSLSTAYHTAGKLELALPLMEETLKLSKAKLGPEHPATLTYMNNLAQAYMAARKLDLALPLLEETLKFRKAKLDPDHPDTLTSRNNLAVAYRAIKKLDLALPLLEETLMLRKAKLGPEHPATLTSMNNLAMVYQDAGRRDLAVALLEETLKLTKAKLGPDHPQTLARMNNLGKAYCVANQGEKAGATLKEFVAGRRKRAKPDDPQFAAVLAQSALELLKCQQHTAAEELLRESLSIREKTQPDAWTTFNTKSLLGEALLGQKKYADAEPLLLKGYEGMMQREKTIPKSGGAELRLPEALDRLIQLYTETNKPEEVKKWQAEKSKLPKAVEKKP